MVGGGKSLVFAILIRIPQQFPLCRGIIVEVRVENSRCFHYARGFGAANCDSISIFAGVVEYENYSILMHVVEDGLI